jgi:hypothetical protein
MVRFFAIAIVFVSCSLDVSAALAGPYSDDLAKCFVRSTSDSDKMVFGQWMFAALSLNPSLSPMMSITQQQRDDLNHKATDYYQRLMFSDCRQQTVDALKYEGATAIGFSFQILGQVAARSLMSEPHAQEGMKVMRQNIDKEKLTALLKDAGLSAAGVSPSEPK